MAASDISLWQKLKTEPPVAASLTTIAFFSLPVVISIISLGHIAMPPGYTYALVVHPLFGVVAILLDFLLVYLFSISPVVRLKFHAILAPDRFRKALILLYLSITWVSFYIINVRLNFLSSLLDSPVATMLSVGSGLVEEKTAWRFFFSGSAAVSVSL